MKSGNAHTGVKISLDFSPKFVISSLVRNSSSALITLESVLFTLNIHGGIEIRADTGDVSHSVTFDANSITFTMNAAYTVDYVAFG